MQDLLIVTLIWLAILLALIGGVILYRRRGLPVAPPATKGALLDDADAAIPPHRLDRIKRGDTPPQSEQHRRDEMKIG